MAQDQGILSSSQRPASQVPGDQALDADHHIPTQGLQRLEKRRGSGADMFVHAPLAVGIEDAEVHPVDVQVDAAVKRVLNRVESPRGSSLLRGMGIPLQNTGGDAVCQQEEAFIIIKLMN